MVPIERLEWLKVARAIFTREFWTSTCRADGLSYGWYLQKVQDSGVSFVSG